MIPKLLASLFSSSPSASSPAAPIATPSAPTAQTVVLNPSNAVHELMKTRSEVRRSIDTKLNYISYLEGKLGHAKVEDLLEKATREGVAELSCYAYGAFWVQDFELRLAFARAVWEAGYECSFHHYESGGPEADSIGLRIAARRSLGGTMDEKKLRREPKKEYDGNKLGRRA